MAGAPFLSIVNLPSSYEPSKELLDKLTPFQFSQRITEYFCKTCGSHMLALTSESGTTPCWDATCGSLEKADESVYRVKLHEFITDTIDGGFSDFLPSINGKPITRWSLHPNKSEQLPQYWQSPERPQVKASPSDRLHCHCKCGGVNFWIARPSERSKKASGAWPDLLIPHYLGQPKSDGSAWWLRDNGTKFLAGNCSCNSCRLDTGMEFISWAFVPTLDISLDAEGKTSFSLPFGTLQGYRSSPDVNRYHCGTCGASAFFQTDERMDLVDVAIGLMDAPEGARAESWVEWTTKRLSFREDGIARAEALTLGVENGLAEFAKRQHN